MRLGGSPVPPTLVAVALLVVAPVLSGCLEAAGASIDEARAAVGIPPKEVPARSVADEAAEAASAWNASARLVAVSALEVEERGEQEAEAEDAENHTAEAERENPFGDDPRAGNGEAPAWHFTYETDDATLEFLVHANGTVTHREEDVRGDGEDASDAEPALGSWPVNSDEALKLLGKNATWREHTESLDVVFAMTSLRQVDDADFAPESAQDENATTDSAETSNASYAPRWIVMVMNETGAGAIGTVHAVEGEVEMVVRWEPFEFAFSWPGMGWGGSWGGAGAMGGVSYEESISGEITLLSPSERHDVPVSTVGEVISIELSWEGTLPTDDIVVRVLDASDNEVEMETRAETDFLLFHTASLVAYPEAPGPYVIEVSGGGLTAYARYFAQVMVGAEAALAEGWGPAKAESVREAAPPLPALGLR